MALPPMGPMSPPPPTLGGPQPNMGPSPMPPMGMGMSPPPPPMPPMAAPMAPPTINPSQNGGQSFGGDAGGRKTFSQYLQSMNTSFPPTPTAPPPMSGGIGGGAPSMPPLAMMGGGAVPRSTMIGREPHRLAYINPGEEMMLRASGGTGEPGPGGVPAFRGGGSSGGGGGFGGPGGYGGYDGGFGEAGRGGQDSDAPGMGPGDFGGGPGDGGPGEIDPGFIDALAEAAVDNSYFDAFETDPDKLADQVAFESISSQVPDIIGPNAPVSNVDAQNAVALATEAFDPYKDVVDFNTASTLADNKEVGSTSLDDAFMSQLNDPKFTSTLPSTGISIPDVSALYGGLVTPEMMPNLPEGFQNMTGIDDSFAVEPTSVQSFPEIYGTQLDGSQSTPVMGQGVNIDDIEEFTALSGTPGYMFGNKQSFNAGKETGIQDPSGLSSFNNMTGIDDSAFSAPVNAQTPIGIQDPSGASNIPQISQAMQNAVTEAPNVNEIANIQAADVYGLPNTGLDTSFSAAQFADTLNPQGPPVTPASPQLSSIIDLDAGMGAAIDNNDGFNAIVGNPVTGASANVPDLGFDFGAGGDMNTPTTTPDPLSSIDLSTKGLGPESKLDLNTAMDLVDDRIAVQKEIDDAGFNPLSLLPFGSLLGTSPKRRQKAITEVLNQSSGSGIFGTGIGGSTGLFGTGAVQFNPVYDKDGNFVGSQGVNASGETVSYSGDMQSNNGYFDGNGENISGDIESYQEDIGGQGAPGGINVEYNPCQPGFELDPETGTCVPIDVVGGGGGSSEIAPIIRPITPPVTTPVEPNPQPAPVVSPVLRTPKQFNMGGATSGSNLDGAISRLLSSMS